MIDLSLHQVLREKRIRLCIGLSEVEKALHVSASSISRWERGLSELPLVPDFYGAYRLFLQNCEEGKIQFKRNAQTGRTVCPHKSSNDNNAQLPLFDTLDDNQTLQNVNHPKHYESKIEAIDFIDSYNLNFNLGNVIKYISRAGHKNGEDTLTALRKAQWYLNREIKLHEHVQQKVQ